MQLSSTIASAPPRIGLDRGRLATDTPPTEQAEAAPEEGDILVQSVDTDELLAIVRESLTRGFTEPECDRFNFGDDCPTLEELRSGS